MFIPQTKMQQKSCVISEDFD